MSVLLQASIRYRNALILPTTGDTVVVSPALIAALLKNLASLGFAPSMELVSKLSYISSEKVFKTWAVEVIKILKEIKGENFVYSPMYPNFPQQVADASDVELFLNAVTHYCGSWVGLSLLPEYDKEERFPLYENTKLTVLGYADESSSVAIIRNLLTSKVSLSEKDVEILTELYSAVSSDEFDAAIPESIPNKENLATVANIVRKNKEMTAVLMSKAQNATDLLRIAVAYSGGHPSLSEPVRFSKLSRAERRNILTRLNQLGSVIEDFKRNRGLWKRLGERLHPAEFLSPATEAMEAFRQVRSNKNIRTWGTVVEEALLSSDTVKTVTSLTGRPGEFARRLNVLLEKASYDEEDYIIDHFAAVASKVSTPVLWQTVSFFRTLQNNPNRSFSTVFPKGVNSSAFALKRNPTHIDASTITKVLEVLLKAVQEAYSSRDSLGKVFYDTDGYSPAIPFGLRNNNSAFRVVGRGTRTPFTADKTLRFFIHWKNQSDNELYGGRVDLDLSAMMLDENFNHVGEIAYYNLRDFGGVHSGDITSAPNGASEFIDIPVQKYLKSGKARYIAMTVHSYTHQKFSELDEVLAGFMIRQDPSSGEIYEPSTVENSFSVNSNTTSVIPMLFDLMKGEAIWLDIPLTGTRHQPNNVASLSRSISDIINGLASKEFITTHDVVTANISARGIYVDSAEEADLVVTSKNGELSLGFDEIIGKWV